ncbi:GT4 family glycosyltransferase PelF [Candidatus Kryptonium thompsonii]|uniref:GT4 family glycosyltransferase PelF n=1 Tax=Candidatus Kryptonium thompsonii TaxID=1633631 RepID=UPI0007076D45|nr:GT4 family glycosyltransferase PelF [Candidatus Kryptonium thompsoni]CUS94652.1 Glycosyltransferase involved in cell wall bisynthesis [Candidatus Kryptonium thompsoni]
MVDVCLILEGTYPYVVGGVSKWTHALVKNLSEIEFSIVHLHSGEERKIKFEVPENVKSIVEIDVRNGFGFRFDFRDLIDVVPEAKVYHSLSTGFAGLLGLQVKSVKNKPLVLTEHGLYWKEIEFGVDEVECGFKIFKNLREKEKVCVERRRYLEIFKEIAKKCYLGADVVTTVCRYNLEQQLSLISNGKNSTDLNLKFRVIENFVEPEFFGTVVRKVRSEKVISFIGRVVPIKDVKTFIRAMPLILDGIGDVKFLIVGDLMQDPEYVDECFELVRELGLVGKVKFTGEANAVDYLKISDVPVFSQPFAQTLITQNFKDIFRKLNIIPNIK